jgi:hypothetical protein
MCSDNHMRQYVLNPLVGIRRLPREHKCTIQIMVLWQCSAACALQDAS